MGDPMLHPRTQPLPKGSSQKTPLHLPALRYPETAEASGLGTCLRAKEGFHVDVSAGTARESPLTVSSGEDSQRPGLKAWSTQSCKARFTLGESDS